MKVTEIFASIDGEGITSGIPAIFVRLYGCNLACKWCDSTYAWKTEYDKAKEMSVDDIYKEVCELNYQYGITHVTITGGEPLIWDDSIALTKRLAKSGFYINIETNGAIDLLNIKNSRLFSFDDQIIYTMDVKCPSSGMSDKMVLNNLAVLDHEDVVKFVVGSDEDIDFMEQVIEYNQPIKANIFVSPVFGSIDLSHIVDRMLEDNLASYDVRFQLQAHKIIWDPNKRGV